MSYASFWIKQAARNYINKCGLLRIPSNVNTEMCRYKRVCSDFERDHGYAPGDDDVSGMMNISPVEIDRIKSLAQGLSSLDGPIADTDSLTLGDTVAADGDIENETIENYMDEQKKNELWGIVAAHCNKVENDVIRDYYLRGYQMPDIARKYGLTYQRIAQIKHDAIGRLRHGKVRKELNEKFEILDASLYSGGYKSFYQHGFTSNVEFVAIRRTELQKGYDSTVDYLNKKYLQDSKERLRVLQEEYDKEIKKLEIRG
jgi:DNA-directed RNA polymerase sigma subunit (sigma70/sigma32)